MIEDNIIDVYHQTASNSDVIKTIGFIAMGYLQDNIVTNRNINSQAEIDMYSSGERLTVKGNMFKNISTKIQGSLTPAELVGKCRVVENDYEFEDGAQHQWAAVIRASHNVFSNNTVSYKETFRDATRGYFSALLMPRMPVPDNGYGDRFPAANTVSGNVVTIDIEAAAEGVRVLAFDGRTVTGCAITGNVFSGGFDPITDGNPETMNVNTWTGNNIYSPHFTPEGIFRMQSQYTGAGNRISTSHGGEVDYFSGAWVEQALPAYSEGGDISITLDTPIRTFSNYSGTVFLLHTIITNGNGISNRQVFLVVNTRNTTGEAPWIKPVYSFYNPENPSEIARKLTLVLGYVPGGIVLNAIGKASGITTTSQADPVNIKYSLEAISVGAYYR